METAESSNSNYAKNREETEISESEVGKILLTLQDEYMAKIERGDYGTAKRRKNCLRP
jgi:hypothetical protein